MNLLVRKRNGQVVEFDRMKIVAAILKAMKSCKQLDMVAADAMSRDIENQMKGRECWDVDEIQELVENSLMCSRLFDVARAYIVYRNKRDSIRRSTSDEIISGIINVRKNDITRENANMNADTPAGMMMKISSERSKEYSTDFLIHPLVNKYIADNKLHINDFDYYLTKSTTCCLSPVDKILKNGFRAGHGESRPAKRIETASVVAAISIQTTQNEQHGGQAIPAFDFYMAPYVRMTFEEEVDKLSKVYGMNLNSLKKREIKDYEYKELSQVGAEYIDNVIQSSRGGGRASAIKDRLFQHAMNMTVRRVHQSMESFIHNMNNISSRGGNQVVFSSVNYGTDTSAEGRCVIRELLKSTYQGVGNGATAIFPIQIWKKKRGVSYLPEDPNYDLYQLACKVTAKRFFPNFLNLDATFNQNDLWKANDPRRFEYEVATMGCRTRVYENRFGENTSIGRGNLSFSTMNLPGLALSVMNVENEEERIKRFFLKLKGLVYATGVQLYQRYQFQCTALAKQFPLLMSGIWKDSENLKPGDEVRSVLKHGTLGVGFIGLAECLIALIGKHHGESDKAQKLGLKIVTFMRNEVQKLADKYNLNYSLFATPAEGLSGRFTKKDKKKYGIIPGVTDKDYYTNSNHIPVYYKCSASHKAKIEGPYHNLTRGGHIFYVELDGDATHNVQAVMDIVDLMDKNNIGYGSVNHNRNRCLNCSYEDASKDLEICPKCGSKRIDKLQRITGYLVGTTDRWNSGKLAELNDRVTHN